MEDARGLSGLYPVVPIMNFMSMMLLLLIIPGFWKTRIVALVSLVGWVFIGNLVSFLGMVHWKGHTNDAPVWANILAVLGRTWYCGFFTSLACFAHFTWQRLQPLSVRKLYDTRRRDNLVHIFFALILPMLWAPLYLFSSPYRYVLIEDFGPVSHTRRDWPGYVVLKAPAILSYMTTGIFSVLALVRYWYGKLEEIDSELSKHHPSVRTRKLLLIAVVNTPLVAYGIYNQLTGSGGFELNTPKSLAENIASLQLVLTVTRPDLDAEFKLSAKSRFSTAISIPLMGFYIFAWFGLGVEARKSHRETLLTSGRLIGVVGTLAFSWSATALRKFEAQQGVVISLRLFQHSVPQIAPYISPPFREPEPELPASPAGLYRPNPVEDVSGGKRIVPPTEPARRLSTHKPPFVPLDSGNRVADPAQNSSTRRLSIHKPPFAPFNSTNVTATAIELLPNPPTCLRSHHKPALTPMEAANAVRNTTALEPSSATRGLLASQPVSVPLDPPNASTFEPSSPLRRMSQHKPVFRPLAATNVVTNATPEPSGSNFQHVEDANNARRRAKFAPRPLARRLSYHKPAFVPLVHANHRGEIRDAVGGPIPLSQDKPIFTPPEAANAITNATPGPSGSSSQRVADADNTRRQPNFAPRPFARRLSYHKPTFEPLVHANHRGEILGAGGAGIPLVEVRIETASSDDPDLTEYSTVDDGETSPPPSSNPPTYLGPPPRSSRSIPPASSPLSSQRTQTPSSNPPTYLGPPPRSIRAIPTASLSLSSQRTPTPAPPYQDVNPFPSGTL